MNAPLKKPGTLMLLCTVAIAVPSIILSGVASRCSINAVILNEDAILKRRRWFAALLRIPGNLVLRFRRAPVKVLSNSQWQSRVVELTNASIEDGFVRLEKLAGVPLSQFLAETASDERKLEAIGAAMQSLFDFHIHHDQSHGDASVSNVMIKEFGGLFSATWFDFDVAHVESTPETVRRADDLRALIFTSEKWLSPENFFKLFSGEIATYPDAEVWSELIQTMGRPLQHCDVFHMAQCSRVATEPEKRS